MANWHRGRDKYGRAEHRLTSGGRTVGVVVRMPKAYIAKHPERVYLSNDWTDIIRGDHNVAYHRTLKDAKARIERLSLRPTGLGQ